MGRPPKYKTAEELEKKCDEYFRVCEEHTKPLIRGKGKNLKIIQVPDPEPYTVPGLAYHLEYADRQSIQDLRHNRRFSFTIKKALRKIESQRVAKMLKGSQNVAGCIFDLKNNFGYKDKIEQEISGPGGGPIALTAVPPTPESLAQWEVMMIESRKVKQLPEKTKPTSNQKDDD